MSTIIQRALNNSSSENDMGITDAEKAELMRELDKLNENYKEENGK
jgi:hypothetical protein